MHELPGLKPACFGEIRLLEIKNLNILLKNTLSKILTQIGSREKDANF